MTMLNIFKDDAFSLTSLTDSINEIEYRSSRIQELGLFEEKAVATTTIAIERIGDKIQLVPPAPRGGKGDVKEKQKATAKPFAIPHFPREWSVLADEVQNVRAFGSESEVETVMSVVLDKIMDNMADIDVTHEYSGVSLKYRKKPRIYNNLARRKSGYFVARRATTSPNKNNDLRKVRANPRDFLATRIAA
ncbi:major capsid protein [Shinella sp. DD12]|uniref:major capsid protein n=1 Tax=Shinella sp. DD12 TaxID=1410620 RepID=UPI0004379AF4|nr:major capsid protein [Shinella sp. DD12]EYR81850.1 phage major capsid protein E [Shinella sp. DD12]